MEEVALGTVQSDHFGEQAIRQMADLLLESFGLTKERLLIELGVSFYYGLEKGQKEKVEVFNIGTGRGVSVLELINGFEKATGVKLNYQIVGRRAGDIEKVWANPDFANNELGWKAVETLEDTLRSAWNWQLKLRERGIQ